MGVLAPIFPAFQQHRQSGGVATPTRLDAERNRDFRGPGGQLPEDGTQVDSNSYADVRKKYIDPDSRDRPHAARGRQDLPWSPDAALMNTVACLQRDLNDMSPNIFGRRVSGFITPIQTGDIYVN